jgi:beta-galactosidase
LGGYPGALREVLGVRVEEFFPLLEGQSVALSGGGTGTVWTELLGDGRAEVLQTVVDGPLPGTPAITRATHGAGSAWYLTTSPDPATLRAVLKSAAEAACVAPAADVPEGVEAVRRGDRLFVINHTAEDVTVLGTLVPAGDAMVLPAG